jgi:hypothetical protein
MAIADAIEEGCRLRFRPLIMTETTRRKPGEGAAAKQIA